MTDGQAVAVFVFLAPLAVAALVYWAWEKIAGKRGQAIMKGYYTGGGYMGYIPGEGYRLFETETAYYEWSREQYTARGGICMSNDKNDLSRFSFAAAPPSQPAPEMEELRALAAPIVRWIGEMYGYNADVVITADSVCVNRVEFGLPFPIEEV